jgi:hypothetical protein
MEAVNIKMPFKNFKMYIGECEMHTKRFKIQFINSGMRFEDGKMEAVNLKMAFKNFKISIA